MRYAARPVPAIEATAHLEQTRASRGLTSVFRRARGRKKCAEKFRFYRLRKSKGEGLLELFWGVQPPFALLRSVEGGTFFVGSEIAGVNVDCRRSKKITRPRISFGALAADRKRSAKTKVKKGQEDRGDVKR